jgi:hypothetical protein
MGYLVEIGPCSAGFGCSNHYQFKECTSRREVLAYIFIHTICEFCSKNEWSILPEIELSGKGRCIMNVLE